MPICLAGMHRSGTSLVTHTLRECGLYLGEERDLVPASPANPDGYWEHRKFVEINEELLRILGGDWATPVAIPEPSSALWREHADLARLRKSAEELCATFAGHGVWGWKDPRNSITLPFWLGLLGQLRIIVSVRHPLEVAASLRRVDPNASIAAGVERWLTYYQRLLADAPKEARLLTHTGSYLCEPAAEIRRVAEFAGLAPGASALNRSISVIRPDLRRNRFTADEVADFDLSPEAIDVYGRMCEEAGWDEGRARIYSGVRAPSGAVAVEEFERLFAARATHTRRLAEHARLLAEADAMFVKQQQDFHRQMDRRDDDLLRAMQTGITVRGLARDYRRLVEYRRMVRQVQRVVRNVIPAGSAVLVISRGDEELMTGSNATCFPQGSDRLYSGYHPASSLNAIGHLEALRARGAEFLVVPTTELWWLDQYREFGRHVRARYQTVLEDQWSCTIFALRDPGAKPRSAAEEFDETMSVCEDMLQREPAILDWGTGWRLASECPGRTVFGPPMDEQVLPYLDRSVDVVAVPAGYPERIAEAERVASSAVVVFPDAANSAQPLGVRWINETTGQLPTVSIIVSVADAERESSPALRSLRETVPERFHAELLASEDVAGVVARASGDILVFVDPGAVVLPGWLPPLLRLFRNRPRAGAAGGKVLASDGRLEYGGGVVAAGGAVQSIGEDDYAAGGPASDVVRQVDWCSPVILATRRSLFTELGGFDGRYVSPLYAAADYCLRLRERGHEVLFQPDAAVVRVEAAPVAGDPPAEFVARWSSPESR